MIKEIEQLNREIERLMTEKTKSDAQKEVWNNRLVESIQAYKEAYGVDLSGKDLSEINEKLSKERHIVETKTKEEFEKSVQIVNLINEGDIKGAWALLGGEPNTITNVGTLPQQEVVKETSSVAVQGAVEAVEELEDDDFYGSDDGEFVANSFTPVETNKKADFIQENKKPNTFQFAVTDDDDEEDEFITPSSQNTITMDDDDDDDFGGFGSILSGSKFQV